MEGEVVNREIIKRERRRKKYSTGKKTRIKRETSGGRNSQQGKQQ